MTLSLYVIATVPKCPGIVKVTASFCTGSPTLAAAICRLHVFIRPNASAWQDRVQHLLDATCPVCRANTGAGASADTSGGTSLSADNLMDSYGTPQRTLTDQGLASAALAIVACEVSLCGVVLDG